MSAKTRLLAVAASVTCAVSMFAVAPAEAAARPSGCHTTTTSSGSGSLRYYTVTAWCDVIPAGTRIRARAKWYGIDPVSAWTSVPGKRRSVSDTFYTWQFDGGTYEVGTY